MDHDGGLPRPWRAALIIATVTALPVAITIELGQFSLLLAACWTLAYQQFRSGHDERAGLALVPLLIKPEMLLVITAILAWRRQFGAFRTLIPATLVAIAVSFSVVGPDEGFRYPLYLYRNAAQHLHGTETAFMFGWNGLLENVVGGSAGVEALLAIPLAAGSFLVAASCWRRPTRAGTDDLAAPWLVATIATLLIDPHLYIQDLAMLAPPACVYLATVKNRERTGAAVAIAVGWCLLTLGLTPNVQWHVNVFTPFLALAFGTLALRVHRQRHSQKAAARPVAILQLDTAERLRAA